MIPTLTMIFGGMGVLFFLLLLAKQLLPERGRQRFCVICAMVTLSWIALMVMEYVGIYQNKILTALLLGQTIVGVYYLAEAKVSEPWRLFRLPFLLTLTVVGYALLGSFREMRWTLLILIVIWVIFVFAYLYRNDIRLKDSIQRIIECCRRW